MTQELDPSWLDPSLRDLSRRDASGIGSGLCRAVAQRMRIDVTIVRVFFIVLALSAGLGAALYAWGTLLTRGPQGTRPIDSLLPGFSGWSPFSQKLMVVISAVLVLIACSSIAPLPWPVGVIALVVVVILRRRNGSPLPATRDVETVYASVDAQLADWRQRMGEAAGAQTQALPVLDIDAPERAPLPAAPRATSSWLAGSATLLVAAVAGLVTRFVFGWSPTLSVGAATLAAGLLACVFAVAVRTRRIPRLVLSVLAIAVACTGFLAVRSVPVAATPGVLRIPLVATSTTVDLADYDLTGVDTVVIDALASEVKVVSPGEVDDIIKHERFSVVETTVSDDEPQADKRLPQLQIDATASSVEVVLP